MDPDHCQPSAPTLLSCKLQPCEHALCALQYISASAIVLGAIQWLVSTLTWQSRLESALGQPAAGPGPMQFSRHLTRHTFLGLLAKIKCSICSVQSDR